MNLILHGCRDREAGPITLGFVCGDADMTVTVRDRGRAFPPEGAPPADLAAPWSSAVPAAWAGA